MSEVRCENCYCFVDQIAGEKNMPRKFRCKDPCCSYEFELPAETNLSLVPSFSNSTQENATFANNQSHEDFRNEMLELKL